MGSSLPISALGGGHRRGREGQEKRQTASGIGCEVKEKDQLDLSSTPKLSSQTQEIQSHRAVRFRVVTRQRPTEMDGCYPILHSTTNSKWENTGHGGEGNNTLLIALLGERLGAGKLFTSRLL